MAVSYANRKGRKYYLHQGLTKTGKPRYYFSRDENGMLVNDIPEEYEISESINGIVSLVKKRPKRINTTELQIIEESIKRYNKARDYRINVRTDEIEIYERVGQSPMQLWKKLGLGQLDANLRKQLRKEEQIYSQFTPILRFILCDEKQRFFKIKRMCYSGSVGNWIDVEDASLLSDLAEKVIPSLGNESM